MPSFRLAPACLVVLALAGSSPQAPATPTLPEPHKALSVAADSATAGSRSERLSGPYPASVLGILDGDTLEMRVTIWLGQQVVTRVRLRGIDAPEMGADCPEERRHAIAARDALAALVGDGSHFLTDVGPDKYGGRVLARLRLATGRDAGQALLEMGHARRYNGGRRERRCAVVSSRQ